MKIFFFSVFLARSYLDTVFLSRVADCYITMKINIGGFSVENERVDFKACHFTGSVLQDLKCFIFIHLFKFSL